MPEEMRRRLAAILAADVAGYSRLMAADERATVAALDVARRAFASHVVANHGRINDMTGDSVLAVFESATGAVTAAQAIQASLATQAAEVPDERRMRFRIGIHLGEVVEKGDGTVYGDGVNIAARLQALARPGGISVSDAVRGAVRGKIAAAFTDQGEQHLKNIPDPVRVFGIEGADGPGATPAVPADVSPPLPDHPSIAVLPFTNMSGDPEQGYFADGMVEDIITALSRFKELFVIARNSSFMYQGRAVDIQQVARELGVRYVLEGSVRKAGNRVRITGQLIEAGSRAHLWAESFDGTLEDVFDLQDRVTARVVAAIHPSIHQAEFERARRKRPADLVAHDYLLRGMPLISSNAPVETDQGIALVKEAVRLDPHYALAHGLLAHAYEQRWIRLGLNAEDYALTESHARAAIAHGGDDAHALALGGFALDVIEADPGLAASAIARAVSMNPNSIWALGFAAVSHARRGDADAAIEFAHRALRINPLDPNNYGTETALAIAYFSRGSFEDAAKWARKASETNPGFPIPRAWLAVSLALMGKKERAVEEMVRLQALSPDLSAVAVTRTVTRFDPAIRDAALVAFAETQAALATASS